MNMLKKIDFVIIVLILGCLTSCQKNAAPELEILQEGFIYNQASFPQCHASTLVEAADGSIIAAWFGGEYERHPKVSIYQSKLTDINHIEQVADDVLDVLAICGLKYEGELKNEFNE